MELPSDYCTVNHDNTKAMVHGDHVCYVVGQELHYHDEESGNCVSHGKLKIELNEYDVPIRKYHLHNYSNAEDTSYAKYIIMLSMTLSYAFVELVFGIIIGSITLQSDAFHMLADSIALVIGLTAKYMGDNNIASNKATFGYKRAEIVGAAINCTFLLASCVFITISAIERFFNYEDTEIREKFWYLLGVALGGLIINIIGIFMFHSHDHDHSHERKDKDKPKKNLNDHGVFLHIMGDFLGSIVVIITSVVIRFVNDDRVLLIDPICSLLVVILISYTTTKLLTKSIRILMQIVPKSYNVRNIIEDIENIDDVVQVHDFYLWSLDTDIIMCSAHVIVNEITESITDKIKLSLHKNNIHNSTIQLETHITHNENKECHDIICSNDC